MVYLVGAGPGNPDLITVRGMNLLQAADVVVYDRLIDGRLLDEVPVGAELINVGKIPGRVTVTQAQINEILISRGREGLEVVRLKGGDPFVFGRGGEEGRALYEAGVQFEVVPGVTSAIAVPSYAGIPLVLRNVSSNFGVVTGHSLNEDTEPDWAALTRLDTLVIMMGLRKIRVITDRLIAHGLGVDTPVAVIGSGTTAGQQVVSGTLNDISDRVSRIRTPAVIVVGEVVRHRESLDWFRPDASTSNRFPVSDLLEPAWFQLG